MGMEKILIVPWVLVSRLSRVAKNNPHEITDCSMTTLRWLIATVSLVYLVACATNQNVVDHSFGFDMRKDAQDATVLDYQYGDSKLPVRAPEWAVKEGKTFTFENIHGPMTKGSFLYVKWRSTATGHIYDSRVDLRDRLPADITGHTIYFMIQGTQLYVYLISPENVKRTPDMLPNGPRAYLNRKIVTIYPDQQKP